MVEGRSPVVVSLEALSFASSCGFKYLFVVKGIKYGLTNVPVDVLVTSLIVWELGCVLALAVVLRNHCVRCV